jgi:hypothetical protein
MKLKRFFLSVVLSVFMVSSVWAASPARFTNGVTNVASDKTMGQYVAPDPSKVYGYFNDFFQYAATDWVLTTQETGSATEAIADDETGGVLLITNGTANNDSESFLFATGKKAWFKTKLKSNDGDKVHVFIGLHIVNTDPVNAAPTDGVYFEITGGATSFVVRKNGSSSTESAIATLGDDTFVTLGYYWDGTDNFYVFVNDVEVGTVSSGTLPDDEYLAVSFGVENEEASANTLEIDYVGSWMER